MPRLLVPLVFFLATVASALTFTTHVPPTRGAPNYAVSPAAAAIVYAVNQGTLYHSADGGATWAFEGSFPRPIYDIAIDRDGTHLHVRLDLDVAPNELDATLRAARQRAARR